MNYWLFSGPQDHWEISIRHGTWGAKPASQTAKQCWKRIQPGDVIFFYATANPKGKPIGVIGFGIAKQTTKSNVNLWNVSQDKEHDYECRAPFEVVVDVLDGSREPVAINDLKPMVTMGMNYLDQTRASTMFKRTQKQWGIGKPSIFRRKTVLLRSHPKYETYHSVVLFIIGAICGAFIDMMFERAVS